MPVLLTITVLNVLALALVAWRVSQLRSMAASLKKEMDDLAPAAVLAAPELGEFFADAKSDVITVEILNPMQLAAKESWFADVFGSLTPALVRKTVLERTQQIMDKELRKYGVEAVVSIRPAVR
jgi:hypothetical protein